MKLHVLCNGKHYEFDVYNLNGYEDENKMFRILAWAEQLKIHKAKKDEEGKYVY